jgi:hypothetical protein
MPARTAVGPATIGQSRTAAGVSGLGADRSLRWRSAPFHSARVLRSGWSPRSPTCSATESVASDRIVVTEGVEMGRQSDRSQWNAGEPVAWTRHDGVAPPPKPARAGVLIAAATAIAGIWIAMLATDSLCPEHRMWVQVLGTVALAAAVTAVIGLIGARAWAAPFAVLSATLGVGVGLLDAVHSPTRGALTSIAFSVVSVVLAFIAVPYVRTAWWARRTGRYLSAEHVPVGEPATTHASARPRAGEGPSAAQPVDREPADASIPNS